MGYIYAPNGPYHVVRSRSGTGVATVVCGFRVKTLHFDGRRQGMSCGDLLVKIITEGGLGPPANDGGSVLNWAT